MLQYKQNMKRYNAFIICIFGYFFLTLFSTHARATEVCAKDALPTALPQWVLVGTELIHIKDVPLSNTHIGLTYHAQMGGATLNLKVKLSDELFSVTRTFYGPDRSKTVQHYVRLCRAENILYGDGFIAHIVQDGLLVLEKSPNVEGIPPALWVFYSKSNH